MNISEEKSYILKLMHNITEERRQLTANYYDLQQRYNKLSALEESGLRELNVEGFTTTFNESRDALAKENVSREVDAIVNNLTKQKEQVINKIENKEEPKEKTVIPAREMREAKEREKKAYVGTDKVQGIVISLLKERGAPMSLKDIFDQVNSQVGGSLRIQNFRNNIMPRILQNNKKVERAMRGFYQYRNGA